MPDWRFRMRQIALPQRSARTQRAATSLADHVAVPKIRNAFMERLGGEKTMSAESILSRRISRKTLLRNVPAAVAAVGAAQALQFATPTPALAADEKPGYYGRPRTWVWNPNGNTMVDTSKWKKEGPYTIG